MKKFLIISGLIIAGFYLGYGQNNIGIGTSTPNANTMLDVQAASTKNGILAETAGNGIAIQAIGRGNAAAINVLKPASSSGQGIYIEHQGNEGPVAQFRRTNASANGAAVIGYNNSNQALSPAIYANHEGTGDAAFVARIANAGNQWSAIYGETNGTGAAVYGIQTGTVGSAIFGVQSGTGRAGQFQIGNPSNTDAALRGFTNGLGRAGFFTINNAANNESAILAETNGAGNALTGNQTANGYGLRIAGGGIRLATANLSGGTTIDTRASAYLISGGGPYMFGFTLNDGELLYFYNLTNADVTINARPIPANSGKTFVVLGGILREM